MQCSHTHACVLCGCGCRCGWRCTCVHIHADIPAYVHEDSYSHTHTYKHTLHTLTYKNTLHLHTHTNTQRRLAHRRVRDHTLCRRPHELLDTLPKAIQCRNVRVCFWHARHWMLRHPSDPRICGSPSVERCVCVTSCVTACQPFCFWQGSVPSRKRCLCPIRKKKPRPTSPPCLSGAGERCKQSRPLTPVPVPVFSPSTDQDIKLARTRMARFNSVLCRRANTSMSNSH